MTDVLSGRLGTGTVVAIKGLWREAPKGKEQNYELHAEDVHIIGRADAQVSRIISFLVGICIKRRR